MHALSKLGRGHVDLSPLPKYNRFFSIRWETNLKIGSIDPGVYPIIDGNQMFMDTDA
jgi:hypothetical protein